jgi:hypothetical protein
MVPAVGAHPHQWLVLKRRVAGSGQYPDWIKSKNPAAPAVKREAEEDRGKCASRSKTTQSGQLYASHASHQTDGW